MIELAIDLGEHPVPSHGGAARGVTTRVVVNGVTVFSRYNRIPWTYTTPVDAPADPEAKQLYENLFAALTVKD